MDKSKRKKGEAYLKKWGSSIAEIEKLQIDIHSIRKNNTAFENIDLDNKSDIKECFEIVLSEKLLKLQNIIRDYKFVEDIINDLEQYQRDTIKYRYIHKNSWQATAFKVHISLRQCFNIKNAVIEKILERLDEECVG